MRILCIDDDPAILQLLERALQSAGHEIVGCATGGEALQQIVLHTFELVIADMMLPDLRGADIIRATKAQALAMPAIGISANQDPAVNMVTPRKRPCGRRCSQERSGALR